MNHMNHYMYVTIRKGDDNNIKRHYIGIHSTDKGLVKTPNGHFGFKDGYIGCGLKKGVTPTANTALHQAVAKYGYDAFTTIVLFRFDTVEEAYEWEKRIVGAEFISDSRCYNMTGGGRGIGLGDTHPNFGKKWSEEQKQKASKAHKGRVLSEDTKQKMSEAKIGGKHVRAKAVIHLETGIAFDSLAGACRAFNESKANQHTLMKKGSDYAVFTYADEQKVA